MQVEKTFLWLPFIPLNFQSSELAHRAENQKYPNLPIWTVRLKPNLPSVQCTSTPLPQRLRIVSNCLPLTQTLAALLVTASARSEPEYSFILDSAKHVEQYRKEKFGQWHSYMCKGMELWNYCPY